jgi:hypothetical protein
MNLAKEYRKYARRAAFAVNPPFDRAALERDAKETDYLISLAPCSHSYGKESDPIPDELRAEAEAAADTIFGVDCESVPIEERQALMQKWFGTFAFDDRLLTNLLSPDYDCEEWRMGRRVVEQDRRLDRIQSIPRGWVLIGASTEDMRQDIQLFRGNAIFDQALSQHFNQVDPDRLAAKQRVALPRRIFEKAFALFC